MDDHARQHAGQLEWPATILFVGDADGRVRDLTTALRRSLLGDRLLCVPDPAQAVLALEQSMARRHVPDVVVVDCDACRDDAALVLTFLRGHRIARHIPVVALAGPGVDVDADVRSMADFLMSTPTSGEEWADVVNVVHATWLTRQMFGVAAATAGGAR